MGTGHLQLSIIQCLLRKSLSCDPLKRLFFCGVAQSGRASGSFKTFWKIRFKSYPVAFFTNLCRPFVLYFINLNYFVKGVAGHFLACQEMNQVSNERDCLTPAKLNPAMFPPAIFPFTNLCAGLEFRSDDESDHRRVAVTASSSCPRTPFSEGIVC
jgi:hypothetical protein